MNSSPRYTEQELVILLKQRQQAAYGYLYDHYATALNGVISNIVPDADRVNDVLQEVFVKIWRHIDNYDPAKGKLFTWMHQIARSTAIDTIRSADWQHARRNNSISEDYTSLPDNTLHPSEQFGLRKLVQLLKEEQKILVDLTYFQGYKQDEIAKMLNIPLGTVKTRLRAALVQLRKQVKL